MPNKDPSTFPMATWALIFFLSFLGGITHWYQRVKAGHARAFNLIELIGELVTSGFTGLLSFFICEHMTDSLMLSAACCGVGAHFSTRLLFHSEGVLDAVAARVTRQIQGKDEK